MKKMTIRKWILRAAIASTWIALLATLIFMANKARAEIVAKSTNTAGGEILFLDRHCNDSNATAKQRAEWYKVVSTMQNGNYLEGCWLWEDGSDYIAVVWWSANGQRTVYESRMYPLGNMVFPKAKQTEEYK
jgi:hypothetical protein